MDSQTLRLLLQRSGSYPTFAAAAAAAGELAPLLPVKLFDHVGAVYRRLEAAADQDVVELESLRLTLLLHEEPPSALPRLLAAPGFSDFAPIVNAVIGGFGELWRLCGDAEIARFVASRRAHLAPLLPFELAHEGSPTRAMERAAAFGGLGHSFPRWVQRLLASDSSAAPNGG